MPLTLPVWRRGPSGVPDPLAEIELNPSVANEAALVAIQVGIATTPATYIPDGLDVYVATYRCKWRLRTTAVPPVANQIATSTTQPTRQWYRLDPSCTDGSGPWSALIDCTVIAATGNDENAGTPAAPIRTVDEWCRRMKGARLDAGQYTLHVTGNSPAIEVLQDFGITGNVVIDFTPGITPAVPVRVVGAFAAVNVAGQEFCTVTDANPAFDWTPHIGRRVRTVAPSAQVGVVFVVEQVNPGGAGNNVARITQPALFDPTVSPAALNEFALIALDTLQIEILPTLAGAVLRPNKLTAEAGNRLCLTLMAAHITGALPDSAQLQIDSRGSGQYPEEQFAPVIVYGCILNCQNITDSGQIWSCSVPAFCHATGKAGGSGASGFPLAFRCCAFGDAVTVGTIYPSNASFHQCIWENAHLEAQPGGLVFTGNNGWWDEAAYAINVAQAPGVSMVAFGALFGAAMGGGILVDTPGTFITYPVAGPAPSINAGGANEMRILGVPVLYAALPFTDAVNLVTVRPVVP